MYPAPRCGGRVRKVGQAFCLSPRRQNLRTPAFVDEGQTGNCPNKRRLGNSRPQRNRYRRRLQLPTVTGQGDRLPFSSIGIGARDCVRAGLIFQRQLVSR